MQLETVLEVINLATSDDIIKLTTMSDVKLTGGKKNPLQGKVTKVTEGATVNLMDGTTYGEVVKEQMVKEGKDPNDFKINERPWGIRVDNTPLIKHNDQYYLETMHLSGGTTTYMVEGNPTNKDDIEGLPVTKVSESSQGGIDNKVIIRTHKLESIVGLYVNDKYFE